MKGLIAVLIAGASLALLAGCQTPEERAMSQMERQLRLQMKLMDRMQKDMQEMADKMEQMDKAEAEKTRLDK